MTKLMCFDLDGTLAESKQPLSSEMGTLLARLLQKMPVAILSGASFAQYERQFFPAFPKGTDFKNLFIFPDNAAQCFMLVEGVWQAQYDEHFTDAEREHILLTLREAIVESKINESIPKNWGPQIEDRGAQITFSALGQEAPPKEKQRWDPTREKRRPLYNLLVERLRDFSVGLNATTSIDITRHGITKAYGIRQLSRMTSIPIRDMLYVGDALNRGGNDAVVLPTHIPACEVKSPKDTMWIIEKILG